MVTGVQTCALPIWQQNVLEGMTGESLVDELDYNRNAYVIGLFIDGIMASTIRLHHLSKGNHAGISMAHFSDVVGPMIDEGMTFIDPTRFASNPQVMWQYPMIPYLMLRVAAMASEYFEVDACLTCVSHKMVAFYSKSFGSFELSPARKLHGITQPSALYCAKISDIREKLATRYPFFKSQQHERKMMFAPRDELSYLPLNILPTAKYAHRALSNGDAANYPLVQPLL
jgi:hypothetical protein